jgi:hypothetical protein
VWTNLHEFSPHVFNPRVLAIKSGLGKIDPELTTPEQYEPKVASFEQLIARAYV